MTVSMADEICSNRLSDWLTHCPRSPSSSRQGRFRRGAKVNFRHAPFESQPLMIADESPRDSAPSTKAGFNPNKVPERLGQFRDGVGVLT